MKAVAALILAKIRNEHIHSPNLRGDTNKLIIFLFHISSSILTHTSDCPRIIIFQNTTPETSVKTICSNEGANLRI
jgi:hypothetical protein